MPESVSASDDPDFGSTKGLSKFGKDLREWFKKSHKHRAENELRGRRFRRYKKPVAKKA